MLHTTLGLLSGLQPRGVDYRELEQALGEGKVYGQDTPIPVVKILDALGLEAALGCLDRTVEDAAGMDRLLAADYAERVLHYFEEVVSGDYRPRKAIEAARIFARGAMSSCSRSWYYSKAWDAVLLVDRHTPPSKAAVAALCCVEGAQRLALATQFAALEAVSLAKGEEAAAAEERWQAARLREYLEGAA